jgi:hypothetical protein
MSPDDDGPTNTAEAPPNPPATNDFTESNTEPFRVVSNGFDASASLP